MKRILFFGYGLFAYATFLAAFLYLIGFMGNLLVPKSIDSGVEGSLGSALAVNFVLILVFGLQHVVMARPGFKEWWTQFVPEPIERSTYVLITNVIFFILFGNGGRSPRWYGTRAAGSWNRSFGRCSLSRGVSFSLQAS